MKKNFSTEQLKRAQEVIKSDRMGVPCSVEQLLSGEITSLLNDYFVLSSNADTKIEVKNGGFQITVTAFAKGARQLKIL